MQTKAGEAGARRRKSDELIPRNVQPTDILTWWAPESGTYSSKSGHQASMDTSAAAFHSESRVFRYSYRKLSALSQLMWI